MSQITKVFYNLFWRDQTCQNLFLLSKEELLDTKTIDVDEKPFHYSLPRIIVSNVEQDEDYIFDTIKVRNETHSIEMENLITSKIEHFGPVLRSFVGEKFESSLTKLFEDIEDNPLKFVFSLIRIIGNEKKREQRIVDILNEYGFIGPHITSLNQIEANIKDKLLSRKNNKLITDKNISTFLEGIKVVKEIYVSLSYKNLYETNQVLVNALHSDDNFGSRVKLFHHLYESKILSASMEDAFIDCTNCEPGTYRGVFQLHLNPNKLKNLKCPVCSNEVKYFVPYELHHDIYEIIREKDGLLQNALLNLLEMRGIQYESNKNALHDVEMDCVFKLENKEVIYFVETKMYKINTTKDKLKSKLKKHFGKLTNDIERVKETPDYATNQIVPLLLVNIIDTDLLQEVELGLKEINKDEISQSTRILNISTFRAEIL